MTTPIQDWVAVAELANVYYRSMYAGDAEILREVVAAHAPVVGTAGGNYLAMTRDGFIERSVASRGEHGDAESRIDGLAIIGDMAQVTIGGRYRKLWFTDTLLMVRRAQGWQIDAKTFFADSASGERSGGTGRPGDSRAVEAVAEAYYTAMVEGDEIALRNLFAADAPVIGTMDGAFMPQTVGEFAAETRDLVGQHGVLESRIDAIQVTGDMALVTVGGRYWKRWFTDQLAMVRGAEGWRIHAKTFYCHPIEADQT